MAGKLVIGDRVQVGGGYDMEPQWLDGRQYYSGTVKALIPGQNDTLAVVVALDEAAVFENYTGKYLVLELRYTGAQWAETGTVHVELCDFEPVAKAWQDRQQGKWVESHATYRKL
jgi:hypothetical protein